MLKNQTKPAAGEPFDDELLTCQEFLKVLKKARGASFLGPSAILYRLCMIYPKLKRRLYYLLKVTWRNGCISYCWLLSSGYQLTNTYGTILHILVKLTLEKGCIGEMGKTQQSSVSFPNARDFESLT